MRSFIAIDMVNEEVKDIIKRVKAAQADIKFVEPQNLHLTLKFLGEIEEDRTSEVHAVMKKSLEGYKPFKITLRGLGAFPSANYIRVLWVGIEENKETLKEMQAKLEDSITKLGFKRERRFEPHLTIGRVRSAKNKERLSEMLIDMKDIDAGRVSINSVELKKSELTPRGPIYTTLTEVKLGS